MTTADLLIELLERDIRLWSAGGELRFRAPQGAMTQDLRDRLREHKAAMLALLDRDGVHAAPSFAQQRLWFLDRLVPGNPLYNIADAVRWQGPLDRAAMQRVIDEVVRRHDTLRTTFVSIEGRPVQVIAPVTKVEMATTDLTVVEPQLRFERALELAAEEARRPFDLDRGPLLRVRLIELADQDHVLVLAMHHVISDGWSLGILLHELTVCYEAFSRGQAPELPELSIQYADYGHWQRERLRGEEAERQLVYWKEQLSGRPPRLDLPADRPRPPRQTFNGRLLSRDLSEALSAYIESASTGHDATVFMILLAAFKCLMHRYTGQTDILVGSPIAGRNRAEIEPLIGFFVNFLVLRTDLAGDPAFRDVVQRVREVTIDAYANQDLPVERLVEEMHPQRDLSRPPIPVAFVLQNAPPPEAKLTDVRITRLETHTQTAKVDLTLIVEKHDGRLRTHFEYNTDLLDESTIARVAADYEALLEAVIGDRGLRLSQLPEPTAFRRSITGTKSETDGDALAEIHRRSNLTLNQLIVWAGQKLQPNTPIYNITGACTLFGLIDVEQFERAFARLLASCDALRTVFREHDGIPMQETVECMPAPVEFMDLSGTRDPHLALRQWMKERLNRRFDLAECLFDSVLIRTARHEHVWYFCHHHLISDGWSYMLLLRHMSDLYELSLAGRLEQAPQLPSFADYLEEERAFRQSQRFEKDRAYWEDKLSRPVQPIGFYGHDGVKKTTRVDRVRCELGSERSGKIRELLDSRGVTLMALVAAVTMTWLHRISGHSAIAVGIPFHNRRTRRQKGVVGLLMEALLVRVEIEEGETFLSVLDKVKADMFESVRHGAYPIGNAYHRANYEVFLNYHSTSAEYINAGSMYAFNNTRTAVEWIHTGHDFNSLAIHVHDFESSGALSLDFDFQVEIFDEDRRRQVMTHLLSAIDACLDDPAASIHGFELMAEDEQERIAGEFNATDVEYAGPRNIAAWLERQAQATPEAPAVEFEDECLTYRQLHARANRLANLLRSRGVGPEVLVAVCAERSVEMVVALLGVIKAGGAYVPLDPTYPSERLAFMLEDARPPVVLTQRRLVERIRAFAGQAELMCLDTDWGVIEQQSAATPDVDILPANPAYLIHTSGSTGRPKGVVNTHEALVNRLLWMQETFKLSERDRVLQKTPFSFDVSVWEFFWPLMTGAALIVARPEGHKDPAYLIDVITARRITTVHFVPSMLQALLGEEGANRCTSLTRVICSGEALSWELKEQFGERLSAELHNLYGPTEAAIDVTHWPCAEKLDRSIVPIGRPIANTRIHILDRQLRAVPVGVSGELCIGGINLARGYWRRPDLTAEKFIPDPFSNRPGSRLYRTGDLARRLPGGIIEFLGRLDHQVKIRGFRIELGEIEACLRRHPAVREAAIVDRGAAQEDRYLAAYVSGDDANLSAAALREHVRRSLPEYMVPSTITMLPRLPLSSNGKLDRKALPEPDEHADRETTHYVAPRNPLERRLVELWEEMLGRRLIGVTDNFFDLGGHSLLAVRMISLLTRQFEREIPVAALFESPTIETLARELARSDADRPWSPMVAIQPGGDRPPLYCVHALFGGVLCFVELARELGADQPLLALQSRGLEREEAPLRTVEEMATLYVEAVRQRQPVGPYRLGGYSMGGVIAFEMARQLQATGEEVDLLVLFDTYAPSTVQAEGTEDLGDADLLAWLLDDRNGWLSRHNPEMAAALKELGPEDQLLHLLEELQKTGHIPPHAGIDQLDRYLGVTNANMQAFRRYEPRPYSGRVAFFRSAEGEDGQDEDPADAWRELCGSGLTVHDCPGHHGTMLSSPHVQTLAARLKTCLATGIEAARAMPAGRT